MTGGAWQKYPLPLMPKGEKKKHDLRGSCVVKGSSFEGGALELSSMTKGEIVD